MRMRRLKWVLCVRAVRTAVHQILMKCLVWECRPCRGVDVCRVL